MDDDETLLARIRLATTAVDPVPDDLIATVMVLMEAERVLSASVTPLLLVADTALVATRSTAVRTVRFSDAGHEVLLRISPDDELVRIDGWMTPGSPGLVVLHPSGSTVLSQTPNAGRFRFTGLPSGSVRVSFRPSGQDARPGWLTAPFTI